MSSNHPHEFSEQEILNKVFNPTTNSLNMGFSSSAATTTSTIANTTTETNFSQNYVISANTMTVGKTFRITARGVYSTIASAGSETAKVKLGSTVIATSGGFTGSNSKTNAGFMIMADFTVITIGASGTIECQGSFFNETTNGTHQIFSMENTAAITIDTTANQTLQISHQWGTADPGNTITLRLFTVEVLG